MQSEPSYPLYRFVNLFIMVLTALFSSTIVHALSTINKQVTDYYPNVTTILVSLCGLQFMIIHPFVCLPANYILDKYNIKLGLSIACIGIILGCSIRLLINVSFFFVLIGNAFVAITNQIIINVPAKFSSNWFPQSERLFSTSLLVMANSASGSLGSIISGLVVSKDLQPEQGRNKVFLLCCIHGGIVTAVMILNLLFFRGQPKKASAQIENLSQITTSVDLNYPRILKSLLTSRNYILIITSSVSTLAILNSLASNLQLIIVPFDKSGKQASLASLIGIICGLIGSFTVSYIVKVYKSHKFICQIQYICCFISTILLGFSLLKQIDFLFWVSVALITTGLYPIFPVIVEFACQVLQFAPKATSLGLLIGFGQLGSFFFSLAQSYILENHTKIGSYIALLCNGIIILLALMLFSLIDNTKKYQYREQDYRQEQQSKESLISNENQKSSEQVQEK